VFLAFLGSKVSLILADFFGRLFTNFHGDSALHASGHQTVFPLQNFLPSLTFSFFGSFENILLQLLKAGAVKLDVERLGSLFKGTRG